MTDSATAWLFFTPKISLENTFCRAISVKLRESFSKRAAMSVQLEIPISAAHDLLSSNQARPVRLPEG